MLRSSLPVVWSRLLVRLSAYCTMSRHLKYRASEKPPDTVVLAFIRYASGKVVDSVLIKGIRHTVQVRHVEGPVSDPVLRWRHLSRFIYATI